MNDLGAALAVGVVGIVAVGPVVVHAVVEWLGRRVALPLLLGRVPGAGESRRARGRCRRCGTSLAPGDLPVLPALASGGRCRRCGEPLRRWYAAVEVACGVGYGVTGLVVGWSWTLVPVLVLVTGLVAVSATDLVVMRIPTRFVYVTLAGLVAGMVLVAAVDGPARRLAGGLVGAAVVGGFLLVLHLISPRALGFGDVRLGAVLGVAVGWSAWRTDHRVLAPVQASVNTLLLAGLLGSLAGLVLLVVRRRDRPFPFGPALALGGLVVCLATVGGP